MTKEVKYTKFTALCDAAFVGEGTDYAGHLIDEEKGAEDALAQFNTWVAETNPELVAVTFGLERSSNKVLPNFVIRVLYSDSIAEVRSLG